MNLTVRFHTLLSRAEEIAAEEKMENVDSYCMGRAMLEGSTYNVVYLAFLNLGYNVDRFIEELNRINAMRGPLSQAHPVSLPALQTVVLEQKVE